MFTSVDTWFPVALVVSSAMLTVAGMYDIVKNGPRNPEPLKTDTLTQQ